MRQANAPELGTPLPADAQRAGTRGGACIGALLAQPGRLDPGMLCPLSGSRPRYAGDRHGRKAALRSTMLDRATPNVEATDFTANLPVAVSATARSGFFAR